MYRVISDYPVHNELKTVTSRSSLAYRSDIDGLRALAVIAVVVFHAFPAAAVGGFFGVDIFFVISGFLITGLILAQVNKNKFSIKTFYINRVVRLFPSLLTVLFASLLFGWQFLLATEYKSLSQYAAAGIAFASNFLAANDMGYFSSSTSTRPLLHLWSLSVEEQFYLFWPLTIIIGLRCRFNLLLLVGAITLISFAFHAFSSGDAYETAYFGPSGRIWEISLGAMLALAPAPRNEGRGGVVYSNICSLLGITLMLASIFLIAPRHLSERPWTFFPCIGTLFVIAAGPGAWVNRVLLGNSALGRIGTISYPLYLWHWPVLCFAAIVSDGVPTLTVRVILLVLIAILAAVTYEFIERPLRTAPRRRVVARWLIVVGAVIGLIALLISIDDGVKSRRIGGLPAGFDFGLGDAADMARRCFLEENQAEQFDHLCDGVGNSKLPLIALWGDSHADSVALGIEARAGETHRIAQFTSSGCPPVIGLDVAVRKNCRIINDMVAQRLIRLKPDVVLLAAYWERYNGYEGWTKLDIEKLRQTIAYLRNEVKTRVVLIGELPTYELGLPRIALSQFLPGTNDRTYYKFDQYSKIANAAMRDFATKEGVDFVSPIDIFCNDIGCLLSTSKMALIPVAWDYGHLTRSGAEFLFDEAVRRGELALP